MAALPYVNSYVKLKESIDLHENDTTTSFISHRCDNKDIFSSEYFPRGQTFDGKKIFWTKTWKDGNCIEYDGTPFFIVGHEEMECHNGPSHTNKASKIKSQNVDCQVQDHGYGTGTKRRKLIQDTKKMGCVAAIKVTVVVKLLQYKVTSKREDLLAHPLVTALLRHKWNSFGRTFYYINFFVYAVFLTFLTGYFVTTTAPFEYANYTSSASETQNCDVIDANDDNKQHLFAKIGKYVIMALAAWNLLRELLQIYQAKLQYLSWENLIEWVTYVCALLLVIDFNSCQRDSGYRFNWQWSLGAIAIFLAWIELVLFLQKFPALGIYVVMFKDILNTFIQFFIVFVLFIIAFALGFYTLLQNQVGLAVDDIKAVQEQAALKRMAMQVELALDVERIVPEFIRRRFVIQKQKIKPNERSFNPFRKLSSIETGDLSSGAISKALNPELDDIEKVQEGQEMLQKDVKKLKQNIKDIQAQNNKLENMILALLKKEGVGYEDEDFQDAENLQFI